MGYTCFLDYSLPVESKSVPDTLAADSPGQGQRSTMSSRSSTSRATLPSEAEVTPDLIQAVPELAGFDGALVAFDSKQQDGG